MLNVVSELIADGDDVIVDVIVGCDVVVDVDGAVAVVNPCVCKESVCKDKLVSSLITVTMIWLKRVSCRICVLQRRHDFCVIW